MNLNFFVSRFPCLNRDVSNYQVSKFTKSQPSALLLGNTTTKVLFWLHLSWNFPAVLSITPVSGDTFLLGGALQRQVCGLQAFSGLTRWMGLFWVSLCPCYTSNISLCLNFSHHLPNSWECLLCPLPTVWCLPEWEGCCLNLIFGCQLCSLLTPVWGVPFLLTCEKVLMNHWPIDICLFLILGTYRSITTCCCYIV